MKFGPGDIILINKDGIIYEGKKGLNPAEIQMSKVTNKNKIKGTIANALIGADILIGVSAGNIVNSERVISIVSPDSAPIKRMVQEAKDNKTAVDATYGRRTRAVLIMDSGHIILSAVQPETVANRADMSQDEQEEEEK